MKENGRIHPFTMTVGVLLVAGSPLVAACPARVSCRLRRLPAKEQGRRYDVETLEVMKRVLAPDSTAIDVGSFKGDILAMMVRLAPRGTHYAFEPLPRYAAVIRKRFGSSRVKVHELALANRKGTAVFQHVVTDPAYSGLLQRGYPKREVVRQIQVRVDRLDDIIPKDASVALIKIDVEGGEYGVLAGGVKTIRRTRPVIIFEHGASSRKYGVTSEMIYRLITQTLGLQVSLMSCWLAGEPPLTRAQFLEQYRAGRNWYFMAHPVSRPAHRKM